MSNATVELTRQVTQLFDPAPTDSPGRVGVEIELFPVRFRDGKPHMVPISEMRRLLAADIGLATAGCVSFEPGGQLELSPAPADTVSEALQQISALLARAQACGAEDDVSLQAEGVNRWLSSERVGLQVDTERYRKMQAHFDAIGPAGRQMMRRTASLQVCLDLLPGRAGREQWLVLNLLGPALAAAFTNQPGGSGDLDACQETRSRIWQAVDPSRTGFDGHHLCVNPVAGYQSFALRAEAIPLDEGREEASPFRATFDVWSRTGCARPDAADVAHHLSTLFPPVRPRRRYLEVRYLDSLPWPWVAVPVCLLATFSYEPTARRMALEAHDGGTQTNLEERWRRSTGLGSTDPGIRAIVSDLFAIALERMDRLPDGYLPADAVALARSFLERFVAAGRAPADEACVADERVRV